MAPKKDENVRHFKVVEVNGKLMEMGRYKGTIPIQAAKKAFKSICEKVGKKGSCALTFTLKETTNGSPKDVHGPYVGEKIKKKKPIVVEFKDKSGKVTKISYKYDYVVYLKKEIMKGGNGMVKGNAAAAVSSTMLLLLLLMELLLKNPTAGRKKWFCCCCFLLVLLLSPPPNLTFC